MWKLWLAVVAAAVVLTGCGGTDPPTAPSTINIAGNNNNVSQGGSSGNAGQGGCSNLAGQGTAAPAPGAANACAPQPPPIVPIANPNPPAAP